MENTTFNNKVREKAIIAGLSCYNFTEDDNSTEETMDELESLVKTAGGDVIARVMQNKSSPDAHCFIGEGKAQEIAEMSKAMEADILVFDNDLSPSQVRALEKITGLRVLDRSGIILDIFAGRAKSADGKLQVELAQYKYLLPRLSGLGISLSRQGASGGGILTRGPGETKLETDRRHIRERIAKLESDLEGLRRVRAEQRRKRIKNEKPVVAIVGYTNAGKSTLLNKLTGSNIEANDRLFDTLDTTTRAFKVSDTLEILLSDTVGFIRKLPHHLIQAFRATLEELEYADLIIHVIDVSNPKWIAQAEVTDKLVKELAGEDRPVIAVFNKADKCPADDMPRGESPYGGKIIAISAKNGVNLDELCAEITRKLKPTSRKIMLLIPFDKAGILGLLHGEADILETEYTENGINVVAILDERTYGKVREFAVATEV